MKFMVNTTAIAIILATLGLLAWGGYVGLDALRTTYGVLDLQTQLLLYAGGAVAVLCVAVLAMGLRSAARIVARRELAGPRLEVYRELVARYQQLLEGAPPAGELRDAVESLRYELMFVAGNRVLEASERFLESVAADDSRAERVRALETLLQAMRRDLVHETPLSTFPLLQDGQEAPAQAASPVAPGHA